MGLNLKMMNFSFLNLDNNLIKMIKIECFEFRNYGFKILGAVIKKHDTKPCF